MKGRMCCAPTKIETPLFGRLNLFSAACRHLAPKVSLLVYFLVGLVLALGSVNVLAQRPLGIDVSGHEGSGIDWVGVKNSGVTFAWAKSTEGTGFQDADFLINVTNAEAAGVLLGAYHYARYDLNLGLMGATNEANWFWSVAGPYIKGNGGYLVPFLDVEQDQTNYDKTALSQWVVAWCNVVSNKAAASGVIIQPMVYTYPSYASTYLDSTVTAFTLDMATISPAQNPQTGAPSCSGPWGCDWTVWQYAWTNTVANINPCDVDTFNGTYATMIGTLSPRNAHSIVDGYCGNDGNGIMQTFLPDAVNQMESNPQNCANCSWAGWSSFGGPVAFGSPATVGYNADLRMQVFVRAADNNVWSIWKTSLNGSWGTWTNYGGNVRGNVSVGYLPNGAMQIFARSSSNTVVTMNQTGPNSGWTAWSDLAGSCFGDPTVGANADGRMQMFTQTSSNTVQSNFKTTGGTWFGWVDYGGSCIGKPAVANLENGVMQVFVRTSTNTILTIFQNTPNGTWGTWSSLGGNCVDDPAVGYNPDGRIEIFTRTSGNAVSANYKTTPSPGAAWSGWNSLGGNCFSQLTVGYNADSRIQLFMRDASYNVQSTWQTTPGGAWSAFLNMAGNTPAVSITTQPAALAVNTNQNATFTVTATNALSYQWTLNGTNLNGATASSYTITGVQTTNAGNYVVVAANHAGSLTSSNALLTVISATPPAITTQPTNQTVLVGQSASFAVVATGTAPLSYQWTLNGTNLALATNSGYALANVQLTNGGTYAVVVTNAGGVMTSSNALLTVGAMPVITNQPKNLNIVLGGTNLMVVQASGSAPLGYQWLFNSTNLPNATTLAYHFTNIQTNQAGSYWAIVSNAYGMATSTVATVVVLSMPAIGGQPQSQSVTLGGKATFSVLASGGNLSYQWLYNSNVLGGATASSYTVPNAQTNNAGNYWVVVANTQGSVTSSNASLTVLPAQPQFQSVTVLDDGTVQMVLGGQTGITYAIDRSADMQHWTQLVTLVNTNGICQFNDADSTNHPQGYYRGRLVP